MRQRAGAADRRENVAWRMCYSQYLTHHVIVSSNVENQTHGQRVAYLTQQHPAENRRNTATIFVHRVMAERYMPT